MEFKGRIYKTLKEWEEANYKAHNLLTSLDNYSSNTYSNKIETKDNKFILVELKGFESELIEGNFNFAKLDKSIIKVEEI